MLQNKISTQRRNKIFACFCEDITATAATTVERQQKKLRTSWAYIRKIFADGLGKAKKGKKII
jgi:hypothetical protein